MDELDWLKVFNIINPDIRFPSALAANCMSFDLLFGS
jgi:hypothetical protein